MRYECRKCNYTTEKKEIPKRCPYCGEEGTIKKARGAQDILDEVGEVEHDRDARSNKW